MDVGCGLKPYQKFFINAQDYCGLEVDSTAARKRKMADVFYDGQEMPFTSNSVNGILCTQVLEHVPDPNAFLRELHRVLTEDGLLLLSVPLCWDEHEQPNDYWRFTSFGLQQILKQCDFTVIEERKLNDNVAALFQLAVAYLYKITKCKNPYLHMLLLLPIAAALNLCGLVASTILPRNTDFYLDNLVLVRKNNENTTCKYR